MLLNPQCIIDSCNLNGAECRPVQQEVDKRHIYGRLVYPIMLQWGFVSLHVTHQAISETGVPETGFDSFWPAFLPTLRPSLTVSGLTFLPC